MRFKMSLVAGIFLCAGMAGASEKPLTDTVISEGRVRNELLYEKMLEQTGWTLDPQAADSDSGSNKAAPLPPEEFGSSRAS